jgi:transcriptional regulator GlxA family with amidase domain
MADARHICLPFFLFLFAVSSEESGPDRTTFNIAGTKAVSAEAAASVSAAAATKKPESPSPVSPVGEQPSPAPKSPSIIQMLEGRESDLIVWLSIAAAAFLIGWVCGGNYYLRRNRARSRKLRF